MIPELFTVLSLGIAVILLIVVERRTKRMADALAGLQSEVTRLQTLSTQILTKVGGVDPAAVQAETDKIAAVNNAFDAALNPPPTP